MSFEPIFNNSNATQRNFDFSVIFSSEYLVGSEKVLTHTHTHTHTHRHLASPNLFLRARTRRSYANPLNNNTPVSFVVQFVVSFCE